MNLKCNLLKIIVVLSAIMLPWSYIEASEPQREIDVNKFIQALKLANSKEVEEFLPSINEQLIRYFNQRKFQHFNLLLTSIQAAAKQYPERLQEKMLENQDEFNDFSEFLSNDLSKLAFFENNTLSLKSHLEYWDEIAALSDDNTSSEVIKFSPEVAEGNKYVWTTMDDGAKVNFYKYKYVTYDYYRVGNWKWIGTAPLHLQLTQGTNEFSASHSGGTFSINILLDGEKVVFDKLRYNTIFCRHGADSKPFNFRLTNIQREGLHDENGRLVLHIPAPPSILSSKCGFKSHAATLGFGIGKFSNKYRRLDVFSSPENATIRIITDTGDKELGVSPISLLFQDRALKLIIYKPGFIETAVEVKLTKPVTELEVSLTPIPSQKQ